MARWYEQPVGGVLLDITGVLYDSGEGGGWAIPGAVDAVNRLRDAGLLVRFCTNDTASTRKALVKKLQHFGFSLSELEIFSPAPAVCSVLKRRSLRPYLLVYQDAQAEFLDIDTSNPNCVVIGDTYTDFSYANMNKAFQILMSLQDPILIALGAGKYYRDNDQLVLDGRVFVKSLEYACDLEAEIIGKPEVPFYHAVVTDMGITPDEAVMVGDDIITDIGGAQTSGLRGVLVRTGKYRPEDETHPSIKPSGIVNDLAEAVNLILEHRQNHKYS